MKHSAKICSLTGLLSSLLFALPVKSDVAYPSPEQVRQIKENWTCQWCVKADAVRGEVRAGIGLSSNDSYHFGNYQGVEDKGAYGLLSIQSKTVNQQGVYSEVNGEDLGLRSRRLQVKAGKPSKLDASFSYTAIPHLISDTGQTPYQGKAYQQLPAGWVGADSPQAMSGLSQSLRSVEIDTLREDYQLHASARQNDKLSYSMSFQRQHKTGSRRSGVAVASNFIDARSAILPLPIDNITSQGDISAHLQQANWQAQVSYRFSRFENRYPSVRFDYAYLANAPTSGQGRLAQEPNNNMQQLSIAGAYRFSENSSGSAQLSVAEFRQNADYLPYSTNGNTLPANRSLDASIKVYNADVKFSSRLAERVNLLLRYRHNEQDNQSDRQSFSYEVADSGAAGSVRSNTPYGFRTGAFSGNIDYRLSALPVKNRQILFAKIQHERRDYTYQSVDQTKTNALTLGYKNRVDRLQLSASLQKQRQSNHNYHTVPDLTPAENSYMRKFNLAEQNKTKVKLWAGYAFSAKLNLAGQAERSVNDLDAEVGLREFNQGFYALDLNYQPLHRLQFSAGYDYFYTKSNQAGSLGFSQADWLLDLKNLDKQVRLDLRYQSRSKRWSLGGQFALLQSYTRAHNNSGEFPEANVDRKTYTLFADYSLSARAGLEFYFRYQDYLENNWQRDDVLVDSLGRVLNQGELSPDYEIGFAALQYRYQW